MRRFVVLSGLFLCAPLPGANPAFAQFSTAVESPRSLALSQSTVAQPEDAWCANPALATDSLSRTRLHANFIPFPLAPSDSWASGFGCIVQTPRMAIAAAANYYRYSDIFSSERLALQSSRAFRIGDEREAHLGMRIRFAQEHFGERYLPIKELAADVGTTFDITPHLTLGAAVTHLVVLYNNQDETLEDRTTWIGTTYSPTSSLSINLAAEAASGRQLDATLRAGIEYALDSHVIVRVGTETATGCISGGLGIRLEAFHADFSAVQHPELGTSLSFGVDLSL